MMSFPIKIFYFQSKKVLPLQWKSQVEKGISFYLYNNKIK